MPSSQFPTSLDTDAILGVVTNNAKATLTASINSSATSFAVTMGTGSNAFEVNSFITIDQEEILVGAVSGTYPNLALANCVRGMNGTTAAGHAALTQVAVVITRSYFAALASAVKSIQQYLFTALLTPGTASLQGGSANFSGSLQALTAALQTITAAKATIQGDQYLNRALYLGPTNGPTTLQQLTANPLAAVFFIADQLGFLSLFVTSDGAVNIGNLLKVRGALTAASLGLTSGVQQNVTTTGGYVYAIYDSAGKVAFAINPDGTLVGKFSGTGSGSSTTGAFKDHLGNTYYIRADGSGKYQIYRYDVLTAVEIALTTLGNNTSLESSTDGQTLVFSSDRSGSAAYYQMSLGGANQLPLGTDPLSLFALEHVAVNGQSNAAALFATPVLTTTQKYSNLMLNGGVRGTVDSGEAIPAGMMTSFVPLVEQVDSDPTTSHSLGETVCSAFAQRVTYELMKYGYKKRFVMSVNAYSGQPYVNIKKGTQTYTNGIAQATAIRSLALAGGNSQGVGACLMQHGESDDANSNANYDTDLIQFQKDLETDYKALTGQASSIPLIISLPTTWTAFSNRATPSGVVMLQQKAANNAPDRILISHACYHLAMSDGAHRNNASHRKEGEYFSKAYISYKRYKRWVPTQALSAVINANTIIINFAVPVAPLVFDTTAVTEPTVWTGGKYGFEFDDGSGSPPSITAAVIGSNGTSVELTLSATPSSSNPWLIRYAWTGTVGASAGPTTGARGNVRDSDTFQSVFGYGALPNWALPFSIQLAK
jgi:hypothetical protein